MKTIDSLNILLILQLLIGCSDSPNNTSKNLVIDSLKKVSNKETVLTETLVNTTKSEGVIVAESKNEVDPQVNEYRIEELAPIRENFKKINSIKEWTSVNKRKLVMTPEDGVAEYYFIGDSLQKIIARYIDKKEISEFYLLNGQLSLAIFKSVMGEDNYEELVTDKNYFKNSILLHKIHSQDCGSPFSDDYISEEQIRILKIYNRILSRLTNKASS